MDPFEAEPKASNLDTYWEDKMIEQSSDDIHIHVGKPKSKFGAFVHKMKNGSPI